MVTAGFSLDTTTDSLSDPARACACFNISAAAWCASVPVETLTKFTRLVAIKQYLPPAHPLSALPSPAELTHCLRVKAGLAKHHEVEWVTDNVPLKSVIAWTTLLLIPKIVAHLVIQHRLKL